MGAVEDAFRPERAAVGAALGPESFPCPEVTLSPEGAALEVILGLEAVLGSGRAEVALLKTSLLMLLLSLADGGEGRAL